MPQVVIYEIYCERVLGFRNLDENVGKPVGIFILRDEPSNYNVHLTTNNGKNEIIITAVTKAGYLQIFHHTLNG